MASCEWVVIKSWSELLSIETMWHSAMRMPPMMELSPGLMTFGEYLPTHRASFQLLKGAVEARESNRRFILS